MNHAPFSKVTFAERLLICLSTGRGLPEGRDYDKAQKQNGKDVRAGNQFEKGPKRVPVKERKIRVERQKQAESRSTKKEQQTLRSIEQQLVRTDDSTLTVEQHVATLLRAIVSLEDFRNTGSTVEPMGGGISLTFVKDHYQKLTPPERQSFREELQRRVKATGSNLSLYEDSKGMLVFAASGQN